MPVVMTAQKDQIITIRALEAGARGFLLKPFSPEDLMLRIQKALRERKRMVDTQLLLGDLIHTRSDLQQKDGQKFCREFPSVREVVKEAQLIS